jgi:hypothetical protein
VNGFEIDFIVMPSCLASIEENRGLENNIRVKIY